MSEQRRTDEAPATVTTAAARPLSPEERREVRRVSFEDEPQFVALYGGPAPIDLAARLRDISFHGARLVSAAELEPKQLLVLRLVTDEAQGESLWLRAHVIWARDAGVFCQVGLRFHPMPELARVKLRAFITMTAIRQGLLAA